MPHQATVILSPIGELVFAIINLETGTQNSNLVLDAVAAFDLHEAQAAFYRGEFEEERLMPKGNRQATGRPRKPSESTRINLALPLVQIAKNSLSGKTATIELGLAIVEFLANEATNGNQQAISLLAHFGVEAKIEEVEPIVVYRPDGKVAAWIA